VATAAAAPASWSTPTEFAQAVLAAIGAPATKSNVDFITTWAAAEGGHWHNTARYNPLNVTQPEPGSVGTGTQGNIQAFTSPQEGVAATATTIKAYPGLVTFFKQGDADPATLVGVVAAGGWGGTSTAAVQSYAKWLGGFFNVPASTYDHLLFDRGPKGPVSTGGPGFVDVLKGTVGQVGSAAGAAAGAVPGISTIADAVGVLGKAASWLSSRHNWIRVLEVVGGIIGLVVALFFLSDDLRSGAETAAAAAVL
jgi:hypothetical protein